MGGMLGWIGMGYNALFRRFHQIVKEGAEALNETNKADKAERAEAEKEKLQP